MAAIAKGMIGRRLRYRELAATSPNDDTPDDRLRERWFGPLIDAEPEEVAAALVANTPASAAPDR